MSCSRGGPLPQVDALVVTELPIGHVAVVADDLPDVLGGHVLLLRVHETEFPLLRIALGLQLLPLASCKDREAARSGPVPLGRMRVQGPTLPTFLLQLLLRHVVGERRQRAGHRGATAAVREDGGHGDAPARVERGSGRGRGHPEPLPRHPQRHSPPAPGPPSPPVRPHRLPRRPALPHHNGGPAPSPPRLRDPDVGGTRRLEGCPISFRAASETAGAAHQNAEEGQEAGPKPDEERKLCLEYTSGGMPGLLRSRPSLLSIGGER